MFYNSLAQKNLYWLELSSSRQKRPARMPQSSWLTGSNAAPSSSENGTLGGCSFCRIAILLWEFLWNFEVVLKSWFEKMKSGEVFHVETFLLFNHREQLKVSPRCFILKYRQSFKNGHDLQAETYFKELKLLF